MISIFDEYRKTGSKESRNALQDMLVDANLDVVYYNVYWALYSPPLHPDEDPTGLIYKETFFTITEAKAFKRGLSLLKTETYNELIVAENYNELLKKFRKINE